MKILALSISAGSGHTKAAEALSECFSKYYRGIELKSVDTLKYINPIVEKVIVGGYLSSLKKTPGIYGKLYEYANTDESISSISEVINDIFSLKIKGLIDEYKPDLIVCTHPFPIEMLSILKRKKKTSIPVIAILTDYAPHSFWFYNHIDAYIIPNEDFIDELIEKGVPEKSIYPLGIPVGEEFLRPLDKIEARKQLSLDINKQTVLVMGGGLGIGNMKNIFESLISSSLDNQIIIVAGNNEKLKKQLTDISLKFNKKSLIYEYTDKINILMSAADILVSKPGGLTTAEALIKQLPIIITSPIPGQEEKNADYLLNVGVAVRMQKGGNIVSLLKLLTQSPSRTKYMEEMAKEKAKPYSTRDICKLMISLAKE